MIVELIYYNIITLTTLKQSMVSTQELINKHLDTPIDKAMPSTPKLTVMLTHLVFHWIHIDMSYLAIFKNRTATHILLDEDVSEVTTSIELLHNQIAIDMAIVKHIVLGSYYQTNRIHLLDMDEEFTDSLVEISLIVCPNMRDHLVKHLESLLREINLHWMETDFNKTSHIQCKTHRSTLTDSLTQIIGYILH